MDIKPTFYYKRGNKTDWLSIKIKMAYMEWSGKKDSFDAGFIYNFPIKFTEIDIASFRPSFHSILPSILTPLSKKYEH